ncbi:MAG: hypothetical protein K2Z81_24320 [Cyanobacteria bacterium]|nr:hypothetical protein [Cyanobacteriota bacterium]
MIGELKTRKLIILAGAVLATASMTLLLSGLLAEPELWIAVKLASITAPDSAVLIQGELPFAVSRVLLILLFSVISVLSGYKLSATSLILVWIQLTALSVVTSLGLLTLNISLGATIAMILASSLGIFAGITISVLKDLESQINRQESQIDALSKELVESTIQIIKDDETERRVLAADLHDEVLNNLKFLRQKIVDIETVDAELRAELDGILSGSMQQIREVMDNLNPAILDHLGFVDAVEDLIRKGASRTGYKVRFKSSVETDEFDSFNKIELTLLYRLIQESINNICKHANASVVRGRVKYDAENILISIADDGVGLSPEVSHDSRGLRYMKQRANIIGAHINWQTGDEGKGTKVTVSIPRNADGRSNPDSQEDSRANKNTEA